MSLFGSDFVDVRDLSVSLPCKKGGPLPLIEGLNLQLKKGEFCALLGPSGCGKTTFFYTLSGIVQPTRGVVLIDGKPIGRRRQQTAMILQDYGLLPWKTIYENVALGMRFRGLSRSEEEVRVGSIFRQVGLSELGARYPHQLSGGQKQRVAIARALVLEPDLLLMDEPFAALDVVSREVLQDLLIDLWKQYQLSIIFVTHSIDEACFLGQKIVVLGPSPTSVAEIFNNDRAGDRMYRQSPAFYQRCAEVRESLESYCRESVLDPVEESNSEAYV